MLAGLGALAAAIGAAMLGTVGVPTDPPAATASSDCTDIPEDRVDEANRLVEELGRLAEFATIAADPESLVEPVAGPIERVLDAACTAGSWWEHRAEVVLEEAQAFRRTSVRIIEADSLFLADRSSIPVTIVNDLDQDVTVLVSARADTGRLDVDRAPITATVPATARVTVSFDAVAVSNGDVSLTAWLTNGSGARIGPTVSATVNVQAGWETPVAAGAVALLLVIAAIGVVRTVRRSRRTTRADADG